MSSDRIGWSKDEWEYLVHSDRKPRWVPPGWTVQECWAFTELFGKLPIGEAYYKSDYNPGNVHLKWVMIPDQPLSENTTCTES